MIQLYTMIKLIMNPKHMRIWCDQANTLDMHATIIMLMANQDSSTHYQGAYLHTATMQGTHRERNNLADLITSMVGHLSSLRIRRYDKKYITVFQNRDAAA